MGKTKEDEAYERGFKEGRNDSGFDEIIHNTNPLKNMGDQHLNEIEEKGYREGRVQHYRDLNHSNSEGVSYCRPHQTDEDLIQIEEETSEEDENERE